MNIISKIFKKRKQYPKVPYSKGEEINSTPFIEISEGQVLDKFRVEIQTDMDLSEEQKITITRIVEDGINNNLEQGDICFKIMIYLGIFDTCNGMRMYRGENNVILRF